MAFEITKEIDDALFSVYLRICKNAATAFGVSNEDAFEKKVRSVWETNCEIHYEYVEAAFSAVIPELIKHIHQIKLPENDRNINSAYRAGRNDAVDLILKIIKEHR
jgi:hypothetical protein